MTKSSIANMSVEEQTKILMYLFAAVDNLFYAHEVVARTRLYRQELKQRCRLLIETTEKMQADIMKAPMLQEAVFSSEWAGFSVIAKEWTDAILDTPLDKIPELLAVVRAYREGGIKVLAEEGEENAA